MMKKFIDYMAIGCVVYIMLFISFLAGFVTPVRATGSLESRYNGFGMKIYFEELSAARGKNLFISPASISFALAMAWNGAGGSTADAMALAMGLESLDMEEMNDMNRSLLARLETASPDIELKVSNSIWLRKDYSFSERFISDNRKSFQAGIFPLMDARSINNWVSEKTGGKIEEIVDSVSPEALVFLVNAVYFRGSWTKEFNEKRTSREPFHLPGGSLASLPMMKQSGHYYYLENEMFQAILLTYGNGRTGMYIFLPGEASCLDDFHKELSLEKFEAWRSGLRKQHGSISLPAFRAEYGSNLNSSLKTLGMGIAFGPTADFSRLCNGEVYINEVIHKSFIEVNEKGTEAAAATSVEMRLTSAMKEPEPFKMIVDRPFFFAIVDNETGLILFLGSIYDPR